jgi:DNA polymerase-3 subunit beta
MRVLFDREALQEAFGLVASVVPARATAKPILENVLLVATPDGVTLMATDLEVSLRAAVPKAEVESPGEALLLSKRFSQIIREVSDSRLILEQTDNRLRICGEGCKFNLLTGNAAEFIRVPVFDAAAYYEMPATGFRNVLRRTSFCTATSHERYALAGVHLEFTKSLMTGVACDGARLAVQMCKAERVGEPAACEPLVPVKACQLLERSLADYEGPVRLVLADNDIRVQAGDTVLVARLLEGRFPRWSDVLERSACGERKITTSVAKLLTAVRQAAVVTTSESTAVTWRFTPGKLFLSGSGAEIGDSEIGLPVAYEDKEVSIRLAPGYMAEALKAMNIDANVTMAFHDESRGVLCTTEDGYQYVQMPLGDAE